MHLLSRSHFLIKQLFLLFLLCLLLLVADQVLDHRRLRHVLITLMIKQLLLLLLLFLRVRHVLLYLLAVGALVV